MTCATQILKRVQDDTPLSPDYKTMENNSAIVHIDGDSFFVSCELLSRPDLRGKPVITGGERGIASAMNTEAKRIGITRGMPVFQIKRDFPQVVILPSNFAIYEEYNARMLAIARRYSDVVEAYSIDECFVDVTHVGTTWEDNVALAQELKATLKRELGLTFSLGLAPTKVLAKVASKNRKPDGFTAMQHGDIENFLRDVEIGDVWGIGWATAPRFRSAGIHTALDFARKDKAWIQRHCAAPHETIWHELGGRALMDISTEHSQMKSIQATRMFPKNSTDPDYVFSHLSRDIEIAAGRLRRMGLYTKKISIFIKERDHKRHWADVELPDYTNYADVMVAHARIAFDALFSKYQIYKAAGVTCHGLVAREDMTASLFVDPFHKDSMYQAMDAVTEKFGDYSLVFASSMNAVKSYQRDTTKIERREKMYPLPYLGEVN